MKIRTCPVFNCAAKVFVMKKIETILAITSSSPIRIPASAIAKHNNKAFLGSLSVP
jgi:hypothetical protein